MAATVATVPSSSTSVSTMQPSLSSNTTTKASSEAESYARDIVSTLFSFITAQGDADYIGEPVSQLEHSLQAAHLAQESGIADRDTVLGALLHDIGRFIPQSDSMPAMIAPNGTYVGREAHEIVGEKYLRDLGFSEKICQLVGAHVMAKRFLCAVDRDYYDGLSNSSKTTLKYQGGPFTEEQVRQMRQKDPILENKLQVRKWDDLAKVPGMKTHSLSFYEEMAVQSLLGTYVPEPFCVCPSCILTT